MSGDITQQAFGLTSILQLRAGGAQPSILNGAISCTIDLAALFLLNSRTSFQGPTGVVAAVGGIVFPATDGLTVPPGELWYVWDYWVGTTPGAGAAARVAPAYVADGLITMALGDYQSIAANENVRVRASKEFWAKAGTQFGALVQSQTLAPTIFGAILVTKLRA